jgi:hypothetical protein
MAWLSQFKLGRAGREITFDYNPASMTVSEQFIGPSYRDINGDLKKSIIKTYAPLVTINSSYLTIAQRNQLVSLMQIKDTFLSFIVRDTSDPFKMILEQNVSLSKTTVQIQNTSITHLCLELYNNGFVGIVTIEGVWDNYSMTGTNYYTGGSFDDSNRTITLGTPFASNKTICYITYAYTGWLVQIKSIPWTIKGGWIDRLQYDFELEGV